MSTSVILITGALTGIGRATAVAFANEGARIVVAGRRDAEGKALEVELRDLGAEASFIKADVRHDDEVRDLVDQTVARFGRLDVAVNTAGTEGKPGPVTEQTAEAALEAASSGVRINAVAPGPIETGMLNRFTGTAERKAALLKTVPLGRLSDPAEIARAAVFLASEKASFITGQILTVDGGKTAG